MQRGSVDLGGLITLNSAKIVPPSPRGTGEHLTSVILGCNEADGGCASRGHRRIQLGFGVKEGVLSAG